MMKPERIINQYDMFSPGDRVICALSGGVDSVVLTHFLAKNADRFKITVVAAHFSHGIRKECAEGERLLCERLCESLNIPFFYGEGDSIGFSKEHKIGLEEAARVLRYGFLESVADKCGAQKIATAHHSGDNIETLIMNACRGAGVKGLSAIPPVRDKLIRPLLDVNKREIEQYAEINNLAYAEDITNFEPCCRRNEVRLIILPRIREEYPQCEDIFTRLIIQARKTDYEIECKAKKLVTNCNKKDDNRGIPISTVLKTERSVSARVFDIMYKNAGGQGMLSSRHIDSLFALCENENPSAEISLPGIKAIRKYDALVFKKPESAKTVSDKIIGMNESVIFGNWAVSVKDGVHPDSFVLDKTKLFFPLNIRSRREGDSVNITGCRKTLKKLMIEKKIHKELRTELPVVTSKDNVIAVAQLGADINYKTNTAETAVSVIIRRI